MPWKYRWQFPAAIIPVGVAIFIGNSIITKMGYLQPVQILALLVLSCLPYIAYMIGANQRERCGVQNIRVIDTEGSVKLISAVHLGIPQYGIQVDGLTNGFWPIGLAKIEILTVATNDDIPATAVILEKNEFTERFFTISINGLPPFSGSWKPIMQDEKLTIIDVLSGSDGYVTVRIKHETHGGIRIETYRCSTRQNPLSV